METTALSYWVSTFKNATSISEKANIAADFGFYCCDHALELRKSENAELVQQYITILTDTIEECDNDGFLESLMSGFVDLMHIAPSLGVMPERSKLSSIMTKLPDTLLVYMLPVIAFTRCEDYESLFKECCNALGASFSDSIRDAQNEFYVRK